MKKAIVILAIAAMLGACSDIPTEPWRPEPPLPSPPPKIVSFTVTPLSVAPGGSVTISFYVTFQDRNTLNLRLGTGPQDTDIIVMVTAPPLSGQLGEYRWLNWRGPEVTFETRRFLTETTTFTLTVSTAWASVTQSQTVIVTPNSE